MCDDGNDADDDVTQDYYGDKLKFTEGEEEYGMELLYRRHLPSLPSHQLQVTASLS